MFLVIKYIEIPIAKITDTCIFWIRFKLYSTMIFLFMYDSVAGHVAVFYNRTL